MPKKDLNDRVTQLEKIVATQSDMIIKLVEMMNHLGTESASTNERIEAVKAATSQQFQDLASVLQKLATGFDRNPPPGMN